MKSIALSDTVRNRPRRVFQTRTFARWSRKTRLAEADLCNSVTEMAAGLIDADLGGRLFKKRVATRGRGKSGGARVLLGLDTARITIELQSGTLTEICHETKSFTH